MAFRFVFFKGNLSHYVVVLVRIKQLKVSKKKKKKNFKAVKKNSRILLKCS